MVSREEIMGECPEEFKKQLKVSVDNMEDEINRIKDLMEVGQINDLSDIFEAYELISEMAEKLY